VCGFGFFVGFLVSFFLFLLSRRENINFIKNTSPVEKEKSSAASFFFVREK